jgi:hypothetical protein
MVVADQASSILIWATLAIGATVAVVMLALRQMRD